MSGEASMALEFSCSNCHKPIIVAADPGADLVCPHCGEQVQVPANAGPAHPYLPVQSPRRQTKIKSAAEPQAAEAASDHAETRKAIAKTMPWVVSVLFHVALALVMMFAAMIVIRNRVPEGMIIPDAFLSDMPGGVMKPALQPKLLHTPKVAPVQQRQASRRPAEIDTGRTEEKIELIAAGGGGGALNPFSLESGGQTSVKTSFYGSGGNAHHIVYVVDRSGSMIDSFDFVRLEMLRSVSRLRPPQDFHVILFASGDPVENKPSRLVPADYEHKEQLAEFLSGIRPGGQTDPTPALKRAFAVLDNSSKLRGKLIYLLTDGVFQDNAKVLAAIRKANASGQVLINTYLYGHRPPKAVEVMKQIANENGGLYKYVPADE